MNAALQALAHITPLRMYFLRTYFRRLRTQADIGADALFDNFLRAMWAPASADKNLVDPYGLTVDTVSPVIAKSLVAFMWKRFPFLHPGEQHDAQEFLRCFLNELHDSLKIVDLRSTGGSVLGHEDGAQENRSDFDSGAIVDGRSSVAADRARARYLANELLGKFAEGEREREVFLGFNWNLLDFLLQLWLSVIRNVKVASIVKR